jgi:LytS/YehU family sensor histidine kinase
VFWTVLAIYLLLAFVGLMFAVFTPVPNKPYDWSVLLSWKFFVLQAVKLCFYSVLYFGLLNMFYWLIAEKHPANKYLQPVLIALLTMALYQYLAFLVESPMVSKKEIGEKLTTGSILFFHAFAMIFHLGLSFSIAYITFLRDEKNHNKVLEEQKMQLEVEKSQANLNFLKAQINPHFLHNTLNFLYAKSLPYSEELSEGILTLSDIMRYALGPAARDGMVALKDEIEHVRNVIKINQLRFSNNLSVRFDVNGVVNGTTTIPFLLITIVENAFKHGDLKSNEHPIEIRVDMLSGGRMHFFCRNKKKSGPKEISTGIGLDNIRNQLDLTYSSNYTLIIKDEADFYTTDLTINAV